MNTQMVVKTYSDLLKLCTFEERFRYLQLNGRVAQETFGFSRFINQNFYSTPEWKSVRDFVILRDSGCDLGIEGYDIHDRILIHHINPISTEDIITRSEFLLNPEYLITTTHNTHNAIHYGDESMLMTTFVERSRNDTCPWKL